jgi:tetraacyldisaccharide 4'-kinase
LLLVPFSFIYYLLFKFRAMIYRLGLLRKARLSPKVVGVGNITSGGTGKTPFTIHLAGALATRGLKTAIISRGYKRRGGGAEPLVVTNGDKTVTTVEEAGDEPFLIARSLPDIPLVISRDRRKGGKLLEELFQPEVIILDDGFQQLKVAKDLDLLLIDGRNPLGNGWLLPAGALREPASGISRADCIIITRGDKKSLPVIKERISRLKKKETPIFTGSIEVEGVFELITEKKVPLEKVKRMKVLAFSGIANPGSFEETVSSLGFNLLSCRRFGDHHWYCQKDISSLIAEAKKLSAEGLITTEKDAVKLKGVIPSNFPLFYLKIGMRLIEEKDFISFLLSSLGIDDEETA